MKVRNKDEGEGENKGESENVFNIKLGGNVPKDIAKIKKMMELNKSYEIIYEFWDKKLKINYKGDINNEEELNKTINEAILKDYEKIWGRKLIEPINPWDSYKFGGKTITLVWWDSKRYIINGIIDPDRLNIWLDQK